MKNSRDQGILVFETKKPYQVSVSGGFEDRTEIICHDVDSRSENIALDLEQMLISAMTSLSSGNPAPSNNGKAEEDQKKNEAFFNNESPDHKDVEEQAKSLEMAFMMNKQIKVSEVLSTFRQMVEQGVVSTAGDVKMTTVIWDKLNRKDKSYICFMYCAFFVNPLERL